MSTPAPQQPSPALFFQTASAYQATECLKTAIELGVFTAIAAGAHSAAEIGDRCQASERGIRALCLALVTFGFLTKDGESFSLTLDSEVFLDRNKPSYVGMAMNMLHSPTITFGWENLTDAVRTGTTTIGEQGSMSPEHPIWETFARAMASLTVPARKFIAGLAANGGGVQSPRVLDIAAGHGMFGIEIALQMPESRVVALDWANVLKVARNHVKEFDLGERWEAIEGSVFDEDLRGPYDIVLLTNFIHHFDEETCISLLKKVRAATKDGGRAITLEFVPNEDRVSPPGQALFNMMMLVTTAKGNAYTFSDLDRMFSAAGFSRSELHEIPGIDQRVVVSET
jgi:SAM-dependent methyltransferase